MGELGRWMNFVSELAKGSMEKVYVRRSIFWDRLSAQDSNSPQLKSQWDDSKGWNLQEGNVTNMNFV